jgi:hypothetical protein
MVQARISCRTILVLYLLYLRNAGFREQFRHAVAAAARVLTPDLAGAAPFGAALRKLFSEYFTAA